MRITRTDIENYQQFRDPKKGSAIFANALTESLRREFPERKFQVQHRDTYLLFGYDYIKAIYSRVYEIIWEISDFFSKKRQLAFAWAGKMPHGCKNGVAIDDTEFRGILEQEAERLNRISGARKKIICD